MSKEQIVQGSTSITMPIFITNNGVVTGAGLPDLVYNSSGLVWKYRRHGQATAQTVTLASATLGTYTSGGFIKDANMPGCYEISIPDAALAAGANWVLLMLYGAANMVPVVLEIELIGDNNRAFSGLKKNRAFTAMPFVMLDDTDKIPTAGLTVTVERLIDGGAFGVGTLSAITDKGDGVYVVSGAAADANGEYITFKAEATGALPTIFTVITVP